MSTIHLESLNIDVLLHLLKFVDPVDCFNLILSGILKGFENLDKGIDLRQRYSEHFTLKNFKCYLFFFKSRIEYFRIKLGLRRHSMFELEIRLNFNLAV